MRKKYEKMFMVTFMAMAVAAENWYVITSYNDATHEDWSSLIYDTCIFIASVLALRGILEFYKAIINEMFAE